MHIVAMASCCLFHSCRHLTLSERVMSSSLEDKLDAIEAFLNGGEEALSQDIKALTPEELNLLVRYALYVSLNS